MRLSILGVGYQKWDGKFNARLGGILLARFARATQSNSTDVYADTTFSLGPFSNGDDNVKMYTLDTTAIFSLGVFSVIAIRPLSMLIVDYIARIDRSSDLGNSLIGLNNSVCYLHKCLLDKLL